MGETRERGGRHGNEGKEEQSEREDKQSRSSASCFAINMAKIQEHTSHPLLDRLGLGAPNPIKNSEKRLLVFLLGDLAVFPLLRLPGRPFTSFGELHHTGLGGVDIAFVGLFEEAVELSQ